MGDITTRVRFLIFSVKSIINQLYLRASVFSTAVLIRGALNTETSAATDPK